MKILKQILRLTLFLILSILLILTQMFIITFVISSFQKLVISNNNYLITANNTFYKYIVFFVIVTTYLSLIFFNKKGLVNLSEDITYLGKFIYNKTFIIIFASISILIFICTIFNIDVVYKDKIISHSIFNIKGVTYRYEDINEVHVGIKKIGIIL